MVNFKVGDRVRCKCDSFSYAGARPAFTAGTEYVVAMAYEQYGRWRLRMIDNRGVMNGWVTEYFELVEENGPW